MRGAGRVVPRPVDQRATYWPGLDGVRALAVTLVILFHLGVPGFQGGLLGVGIFFTLSGYLITGLLLKGWQRRNGWDLKTFWLRRARRLLPAVVVVLITTMVVVALTEPSAVRRSSVQALAALFYVANWHTIATGGSYFTQIRGPGPFDHLWSLAVEEQFYLIWPLLVVLLVAVTRGRLKIVAGITAGLAAASFVALAVLARTGVDNTRAYEGTDTRAGGLLLGACLAIAMMLTTAAPRTSSPRRGARFAADAVGLVGLLGIGWLVTHTDESTIATYRWGLLLLSVSAAGLLVAVVHSGTLLSKVFAIAPLRWVGERSYSLYLWHLPVIVFTPDDVLATQPVLKAGIQVLIMVSLAAASWRFIEDPIRIHGLFGALRGRGERVDPPPARRQPSLVLGASVFLPLAVLAMLLPQVLPRHASSQLAGPPAVPSAPSAPSGSAGTQSPATATPGRSSTTKCSTVMLVGDSTSEGLYGKASALPPDQNLQGQLKSVGVSTFDADISGARSIIESFEREPSGKQVVQKYAAAGYQGCWIIALGNVDAATVEKYAPDTTTIEARINTVMDTIGKDQPVLWLTTRTIREKGSFPARAYPPWNQGLVDACSRYPNLRVYDWASANKTAWFGPDRIHSSTTGYRHKAELTAAAMTTAFPATGQSTDTCLVNAR